MPITVASALIPEAPVGAWHQRKMFYANKLWWLIYADGSDQVYKTSSDNGYSWGVAQTFIAGLGGGGPNASIWFDGTYIHYARCVSVGGDIYYRRGTPESDGTITWSAAEQTVETFAGAPGADYVAIAVDSNGYPWIGYMYYDGTDWFPYVTKSSTNDGTWTTDAGFPYQLNATGVAWASFPVATPIPLTGGKVYIVYGWVGITVRGALWDGVAMGAEETASTSTIVGGAHVISAVADGDDLYLVFITVTATARKTLFLTRTDSTWSSEEQIGSDDTTKTISASVLGIDDKGRLYCVVATRNANKIDVWRRWGTTWINTFSVENETDARWNSVVRTQYTRQIPFVWRIKENGTYSVRFSYMQIPRPETNVSSSSF